MYTYIIKYYQEHKLLLTESHKHRASLLKTLRLIDSLSAESLIESLPKDTLFKPVSKIEISLIKIKTRETIHKRDIILFT